MQQTPLQRLEAAIAAGAIPTGVLPHDLLRQIEHWDAWCRTEDRDPRWLSAEAGAGYLDALLEDLAPRAAYARFATFQIAAGHAWGPESSAHLARTLRVSRVSKKKAPADRWAHAAAAVARLPTEWRASFEALLTVSRDAPQTRGTLIWSAARIAAVATALSRFSAFAGTEGAVATPTASLFQAWAESVVAGGGAAITAAAYLARVVDGFERVLTPGLIYDAAAAVADRWAARADDAPRRKNKTARIVPASELDALGFKLMAEADAAPLRRMTEATLFRNGLMLALAATLPERARAIAALEFDVTLFLEPGGVIRFAIPGEALKVRETRKSRRGFHASVHRPSLHRALARWRAVYRPMFDGGAWLWPSRLDQEHGLIPNSISTIIAAVTEDRLDRRVSLHLVRDCVATEIIETDPVSGALRAKGVLRHKDAAMTSDFYSHAEGLVVGTQWQEIVDRRVGSSRKSLAI